MPKKLTKRDKLWAAWKLAKVKDLLLVPEVAAREFSLLEEVTALNKITAAMRKKIDALGYPGSAGAETFKREIMALDALDEARAAVLGAHAAQVAALDALDEARAAQKSAVK